MLSQLISGASPKRFSVCAIALAAFSIFLASSANAQTAWTVMVSPPTQGETLTYVVRSTSTGPNTCAQPPNPLQGYVYVCPGDTLQWATPTSYELSVYVTSPVLTAQGSTSAQAFATLNGGPAGGTVISSAGTQCPTSCPYAVAVVDKSSRDPNHMYVQQHSQNRNRHWR